jgi:DnaJ family protein C protein 1
MAYKLKDNIYQTPGETDKLVENINKELQKKAKTKPTDQSASEKHWTQEQQKALEAAIQKYPKKGNEDRWAKIASGVPGKTKEECQARYKYLVELVKKQKEEKEKEQAIEEKSQKENLQVEEEEVIEEEPQKAQDDGRGKKRNKRKEKKKNVDYYADDYSDEDENFSD